MDNPVMGPARWPETGDESVPDRITIKGHNDGNCLGCRLGSPRIRRAGRNNDVDLRRSTSNAFSGTLSICKGPDNRAND